MAMTVKEQKRMMVLQMMKDLPIVSTTQIATFFKESGSPQKRASEIMKSLEKEGLVEGKRREIGKPKVWRLSSNGRSQLKIRKRPMPLNSLKIDHTLAIGDVWLTLARTGKLQYFKYEPIDPFTTGGRSKVYAPDGFYIFDNKAYLLEVQLSPLSTIRWGEKWAIATAFFDEGHYTKATWQVMKGHILIPEFVVISNQGDEVIKGGSRLKLNLIKEIKELALI